MDRMQRTHDEIEALKNRRLCAQCVDDPWLDSEIRKSGTRRSCSYCGRRVKTINLAAVAQLVDEAMTSLFLRTPAGPTGWEVFLQAEGRWQRDGDDVLTVITEVAGVDRKIAEDIRVILHDQHYDLERAQIGEEGPYDRGARYARRGLDDRDWDLRWRRFVLELRERARFFSVQTEKMLEQVFRDVHSLRTYEGQPAVVDAGPGKSIDHLFRARLFDDNRALMTALETPDQSLGPPPTRLARAGRMNPAGISVFYGATDRKIALAEVRPPVGSNVVVALFKIIRNLKLLDVERLQQIRVEGSVFDPAHAAAMRDAVFLDRLAEYASRPVLPSDEAIDYAVTQAIVGYLAERVQPALDGLIFRSVQAGREGKNVVLFPSAARVEPMDPAEGQKREAHFLVDLNDRGDPDRHRVSYAVFDKSTVEDRLDTNPASKDRRFEPLFEPYRALEVDDREHTLQVDRSSLTVHQVDAVQIQDTVRLVEWRVVMDSDPSAPSYDDIDDPDLANREI